MKANKPESFWSVALFFWIPVLLSDSCASCFVPAIKVAVEESEGLRPILLDTLDLPAISFDSLAEPIFPSTRRLGAYIVTPEPRVGIHFHRYSSNQGTPAYVGLLRASYYDDFRISYPSNLFYISRGGNEYQYSIFNLPNLTPTKVEYGVYRLTQIPEKSDFETHGLEVCKTCYYFDCDDIEPSKIAIDWTRDLLINPSCKL